MRFGCIAEQLPALVDKSHAIVDLECRRFATILLKVRNVAPFNYTYTQADEANDEGAARGLFQREDPRCHPMPCSQGHVVHCPISSCIS